MPSHSQEGDSCFLERVWRAVVDIFWWLFCCSDFEEHQPIVVVPPIVVSQEEVERYRNELGRVSFNDPSINLTGNPAKEIRRAQGLGVWAFEDVCIARYPTHEMRGQGDFEYREDSQVVAISLPRHKLQAFPEALQRRFAGAENLEIHFAIHNDHIERNERNIVAHRWVFKGLPLNDYANRNEHVSMGVFELRNARGGRDIGVNRFSSVDVHVHEHHGRSGEPRSLAMSPDNAHIILGDQGAAAFIVAIDRGDRGRLISFNVVLRENSLELEAINQAIRQSLSIREFLQILQQNREVIGAEVVDDIIRILGE